MNKLRGINSSNNEAQRLMALEMLRTPGNSHFIDEARVSGASAEDAALSIVKSMVQSNDSGTEIANFIKKIRGLQSVLINQTIYQNGPYMYMDESSNTGSHDPADEIVAEIMRIRILRGEL